MKKILILLVLLIALSCDNKDKYPVCSYSYRTVVPPENVEKYEKHVIELTRAASQYMTGGDYEDADDTIEAAQDSAMTLYGVRQKVLYMMHYRESGYSEADLKDAKECQSWRQ